MHVMWPTKKHPEHFDKVRRLTKRRKQLKSEVDILDKNKENLAAFQSKSISAFTTAVTSRLIKAFPDRYDPRTATGKIKLQKDIANIRIACNNKIPNVSSNERLLFLELLEQQQQHSSTQSIILMRERITLKNRRKFPLVIIQLSHHIYLMSTIFRHLSKKKGQRKSVAEDTVPVLVVVSQAIQIKPGEDMTTMVRENAAVRKLTAYKQRIEASQKLRPTKLCRTATTQINHLVSLRY